MPLRQRIRRAFDRWQMRRFHRSCDRLGIPDDTRERILKATKSAPDWYAGRKSA